MARSVLTFKTCSYCGREFIPAACHIYYIKKSIQCGYNCNRAEKQRREDDIKSRRKQRVLEAKMLKMQPKTQEPGILGTGDGTDLRKEGRHGIQNETTIQS